MSLDVQFQTLMTMMMSGAAMGLVFDAYRVLAGHYRAARWMIPLFDIVYWLSASVFAFSMLYDSNEGQLRLIIFVAIGAGICFHFALISRWAIKLFRWLIAAVESVIRFTMRLLNAVVVKPILFFYRIGLAILGYLAVISIFLFKIMIQLLYPVRVVLRWLWRPVAKRLSAPAWLKRFFRFVQQVFKR